MRAIYSLLVFLLVLPFCGCKKVDELTQFNMVHDATVIIPSSAGINLPFNVFSPSVTSNSEATFAVNDTRKDLIEEIKLTHLSLRVDSPSNGNFNFLESVSIFINASGLPETKIAWRDEIPANGSTTIDLSTSTADIKEYIKKDEFSLRVSTVTDEVITQDHQINVHSVCFVDAKILGQ